MNPAEGSAPPAGGDSSALPAPAVLRAERITKEFGGLVAVGALDLEVVERSIHSVIGPNGAGKTTVFNCVTGFYRPEEGEVLFRDEPVNGLDPDQIARLGVARTYQNIRLFGSLSVFDNVRAAVQLHRCRRARLFRTHFVAQVTLGFAQS